MKRPIRVAAIQLRAHGRSEFAQAWPQILSRVRDAAPDAQLLVLPEGTIPAYVLGEREIDEREIEAAVSDLRALAAKARVVIVAGVASKNAGEVRNGGIVIDADGSLAGRADKIFLWHFDRQWFAAGTRLVPISTSLGRLGVLICADGRMPEIARTLVDRDAELLVMPTAWVSSGRSSDELENFQADILGRVRAFENGVPFVAANKCGVERSMVLYCGKSQIVDGTGTLVAIAGERAEGTLFATVEIGEAHPQRAALPRPVARTPNVTGVARIAISAQRLPGDIAERMAILECAYAIAPGDAQRIAQLDADVPLALVDDTTMLDPGVLPAYRRAGYRLALWTTRNAPWTQMLARARAGESRMYVIVIDAVGKRAFVVDPDHSIVCGTFDDYRIAGCAVDLTKTEQTLIVPGTDIAEGLERVHAMTMGSQGI